MRGVLNAAPGWPSRSRRMRPPVVWARWASLRTQASATACASPPRRVGSDSSRSRVKAKAGRDPASLRMTNQTFVTLQQIGGHFGHYDFHDAFAVACAGDTARFGVCVAAAADARGIADAPGKFAAGAAGG